jgi:hypothetical protein
MFVGYTVQCMMILNLMPDCPVLIIIAFFVHQGCEYISLHAENKSYLGFNFLFLLVLIVKLRRLSDKIGNLYSSER